MTTLQVIAIVIVAGCLTYFLYDVIRHAKDRGGNVKQILIRVFLWLLVFMVFLCINLLINEGWVAGKWLFTISF